MTPITIRLHFKVLVTKNGHPKWIRPVSGKCYWYVLYHFSWRFRIRDDGKTWLNAKSRLLGKSYSGTLLISKEIWPYLAIKSCQKKTLFFQALKKSVVFFDTILQPNKAEFPLKWAGCHYMIFQKVKILHSIMFFHHLWS